MRTGYGRGVARDLEKTAALPSGVARSAGLKIVMSNGKSAKQRFLRFVHRSDTKRRRGLRDAVGEMGATEVAPTLPKIALDCQTSAST